MSSISQKPNRGMVVLSLMTDFPEFSDFLALNQEKC